MLTLIPFWARALAIALLVATIWFHGWVKGAHHIQQQYDTYIAKQAEESNRILQARTIITERISDEHAKEDQAIAAKYAAARRLLDANAGAKPVSGSATICKDTADNQRLQDAVSSHMAEVRSIINSEREETLGLFEQAERNTKSLTDTQRWLDEQGKVR
jgi:hypothetical protein